MSAKQNSAARSRKHFAEISHENEENTQLVLAELAAQRERVDWFHGQVEEGGYPSHISIMDEFEVNAASAYRDIDYLKYILKAPLSYDYEQHGYSYAADYEIPDHNLSEGDLAALLLLDQMRKAYKDTEFGDVLDGAIDILNERMQEAVSIDYESLDQILQVEIDPFPQVDIKVFLELLRSIRNKESIILKYFSGQKAVLVEKPCDPYHLINFKDNWYLVAFCHEKQDYRDFLCSRILEVEHSNVTFLPDPDFSLEQHKKESQLFASEAPEIEIVAEFDKYAAHWIRLKKVHPSQEVIERADGSVEVTFKVNSTENIVRWILSFGEHARILSPGDLQERMRRTISRMTYLYNRF